MWRHLRLIVLFIRLSIQNDAAYRFDFFVRVLLSLGHLGGELLTVWIIYSNTSNLNGWGPWHMLTLLGVWRIVIGTIGLFIAPNMRQVMDDIRQGTLDFLLLKPLDSQFLASFRKFLVWRVTDLFLGMGLACTAVYQLLGTLPVSKIGTFLLMLTAGLTVVYSLWLCLATLAFWFTRIDNIEMIFWNVFEVGRYPIVVYPPWLQWILTFILPVAFITTVPAESFFGSPPLSALAAGCLLAPLTLVAASWFWRYGVKNYRGASA
jgi:ABC-2 type transport system permease protein